MDGPRLVLDMWHRRSIWSIPDWAVQQIRTMLPLDWQLDVIERAVKAPSEDEYAKHGRLQRIVNSDVYFGFGFPRRAVNLLKQKHKRLRWVHTGAAGYDSMPLKELFDHGVTVTNSRGVSSSAVAETVLALVHYFARGIDYAAHGAVTRSWSRTAFDQINTPLCEIRGGTMGIIGYGSIGRAVGRRARSLGMHVLGIRRRDLLKENSISREPIRAVLRESDYVVLALPATSETHALIGPNEFGAIKHGAVLVNVGRGLTLDERALIRALMSGTLRGAALDVTVQEPLPPESPLWSFPNLLILPHISANSQSTWNRQLVLMKANLKRFITGRQLLNKVTYTP